MLYSTLSKIKSKLFFFNNQVNIMIIKQEDIYQNYGLSDYSLMESLVFQLGEVDKDLFLNNYQNKELASFKYINSQAFLNLKMSITKLEVDRCECKIKMNNDVAQRF